MIDNLTISYTHNGLDYQLCVPTTDESLPYNLGAALIDLIDKSNANPHMVIDEIINQYGEDEK